MGRASIKKNKNEYQLAREAAGLTREKASEKTGISVTQIVRIENERIFPHPHDVISMAKAYGTPHLCNHFCSSDCAIGRKYVDEIPLMELPSVVMGILDAINTLEQRKSCLIRLSADGEISRTEEAEFYRILGELDKLSDLTDALKLWRDTMVAKGRLLPENKK